VAHSLRSTPSGDPPPWLRGVYDARRQRTVDLVRASIDALQASALPVSLSTVVSTSQRLDPGGKGISESAVLNNAEARLYYQAKRTWKGVGTRRTPHTRRSRAAATRVKVDRDQSRVRQRYLRLRKDDLVERLVAAEQACAEHEQRWLQTADDLFACMLVLGKLCVES
jgi:hypothetical protein